MHEELISKLRQMYIAAKYEQEIEYEIPLVDQLLGQMEVQFGGLYKITDVLGLGGSGIAFRSEFIPLGNEAQVIKLPRPIRGQESEFDRIITEETSKLRKLRHENVIRITFQGTLEGDTNRNFYAMEELVGAQDADKHLLNSKPDDSPRWSSADYDAALLSIVGGAIRGVDYLHSHDIIHLDIKPGNIFVNAQHHAVIADFGFAKDLRNTRDLTDHVAGTAGYMHPDYAKLMNTFDDENKYSGGAVKRSDFKLVWDIFSLGMTIQTLLKAVDSKDPRGSESYERRYLRVMSFRMLDGWVKGLDLPYGLSEKVFVDTKYDNVRNVAEDFAKLSGEFDIMKAVPEMSRYQPHRIQAASHGVVPFTPRIARLIDTPEVRRLSQVSQLGMVGFVYTTASHSRLEHSLGTLAMVCRYVRALYNDPINPLFKQIVTTKDIEAVLAASLLHDIGHYPLAHDLEEVSGNVFGHEDRSVSLIANPAGNVANALARSSEATTERDWQIGPADVIAILKSDDANLKNQILASCISGPIDADKVDYLVRDSENLRLPYGKGIDVDRLVQSLTVVPVAEDRDGMKIGIHERGKIAAESLAFARYAMYGSVYWHHAHRCAKSMLNHIGYLAMQKAEQDDAHSKNGLEKTLREDLATFLKDVTAQQPELPGTGVPADDSPSVFVDPGTEMIIRWLERRGHMGKVRKGHILANGLLRRKLYKRVIVISETKDTSFNWNVIGGAYKTHGMNWRFRLKINELLQERILNRVYELAGTGQTTLAENNIVELKALALDGQLILLDYPPEKPGSPDGLTYLREGGLDRANSHRNEIVHRMMDASPAWRSLRDDSRKSLAKLRLFCHPKALGPILDSFSRDELKVLIEKCVKEVHKA